MLVGLLGAGGSGREIMPLLARMAEGMDQRPRIFFVETTPSAALINGYPVLSEEEFLSLPEEKHFNVAVGDCAPRRQVAERFVARGAIPLSIRSPDSTLYDAVEIGEGAVLCSGTLITSNVRVGRFFQMNPQSYLAHDCVVGDFVTFCSGVRCNGHVVIEDDVYVGSGALFRNGTRDRPLRIGRGAMIGMGAVVTKDVPAGETWVGNPARKLEKR